MKIIKLNLSGNFAHFKMPETNNKNITFLQIHKIALKGLLGATIGLSGYNTARFFGTEIGFLTKLDGIRIGIIPNVDKGLFLTDMFKFTNTTGHASKEKGGVLIIEEKILINPNWDIYLDLSSLEKEIQDKLEDYLINEKRYYLPYFGKNTYDARIKEVEILELEKEEKPEYCSSLFINQDLKLDSDILTKDDLVYGDRPFLSTFFLPTNIEVENIRLGYRDYKQFLFTNYYIDEIDTTNRTFIKHNDKIIELF